MSQDLISLRLTPRRAAALERMIDMQLVCESALPQGRPDALERDEAMRGDALPIQDGEAVIYPIACTKAELRQRRGEDLPRCRWVSDEGGMPGAVACTECGKSVGPGMVRHTKLRTMVEGSYIPIKRELKRLQGLDSLGLVQSDERDEDGSGSTRSRRSKP